MTRPPLPPRLSSPACVAIAGCGGSHHTIATSGATRRASTSATPRRARDGSVAVRRRVRPLPRRRSARRARCPTRRRACARWPPRPDRSPPPAGAERSCSGSSGRRQDQSDSYLLAARDDAHTFYAQITLRERHGRWLVVQLTPPDFVQAFAPAGPQPPAPPRGSAGAQDAARAVPPAAICRGSTARRLCTRSGPPPRACWRACGPIRRESRRRCARCTPGGSDRPATARQRMAGASEHHRRPRDLRARPHHHACPTRVACQQRRQSAMSTSTHEHTPRRH